MALPKRKSREQLYREALSLAKEPKRYEDLTCLAFGFPEERNQRAFHYGLLFAGAQYELYDGSERCAYILTENPSPLFAQLAAQYGGEQITPNLK